ncbi:hypothetical protein LX32DRAFT_649497 [Colletotrichum zoysiae]|uniref:Uncharacterized protein n=1 Tax=Colletotrichum zoysiae TaxID=1216348 RepID=A0AAD9M8X6_9PEZI|nr:hypothetical protein LX32DRAFT_649497 [Colletotrichum zoysiae]
MTRTPASSPAEVMILLAKSDINYVVSMFVLSRLEFAVLYLSTRLSPKANVQPPQQDRLQQDRHRGPVHRGGPRRSTRCPPFPSSPSSTMPSMTSLGRAVLYLLPPRRRAAHLLHCSVHSSAMTKSLRRELMTSFRYPGHKDWNYMRQLASAKPWLRMIPIAGLDNLQASTARGHNQRGVDLGGKTPGQNVVFKHPNLLSLSKHVYSLHDGEPG